MCVPVDAATADVANAITRFPEGDPVARILVRARGAWATGTTPARMLTM